MSPPSILIYSCGSPIVVDYEEMCRANGVEVQAIVENWSGQAPFVTMRDKLVAAADLSDLPDPAPFLCPLFTPSNRERAVQEARDHSLVPYPLLSDHRNELGGNFAHGVGCYIGVRTVVGSQSQIGDHVLINRGAVLGHHLSLDDFVSIGPGVVCGGNVRVQRGAMIGAGAVLLPTITIGRGAVVGAGSVVTKDVEEGHVVTGNPARLLKTVDAVKHS